jgi:uncharacterized protein
MRPLPTLAATAVALALAIGSTAAPALAYDTIDCQRDTGPAERAICSSQRLQTLDAQVTEKYTDIMLDSHIKSSVKQAVHESQVNFLHRRNHCGADADCLAEVMERRAVRINYYR